jgi:hypothetical protein
MMTKTWSELGKPTAVVKGVPVETPAELPDDPVAEEVAEGEDDPFTEVESELPPELPA